ncbi:uncharacterized protein LOC122650881 [Telopea speciosissima]|uniref:uncharacterized protein LOC122650881 n=1 Tax=Telopea speciosissima TaxID=54955 RepID=UPI001CC39239|nr:uncharacterized protein LOC122650881 [Telopea speciosissima]
MERFKKLQPTYFSKVDTNPLQPERWISAMERTFEVLECTDAQKLICVEFQLQDKAAAWWKSARPNLEEIHPNPTWEQFKEAFFENFFPKSFRDEKEAGFEALTQGLGSILDYQQQFKDLFHFASAHMRGDACKAKKFEKGLKPEISAMLAILEIQSYA